MKSLREGGAQLAQAYAEIRDGEAWLVGATIAEYAGEPPEPRPRARPQAPAPPARDRLALRQVREKGLTLVPTRLYFKDGRVKVELAVARGKERGQAADDRRAGRAAADRAGAQGAPLDRVHSDRAARLRGQAEVARRRPLRTSVGTSEDALPRWPIRALAPIVERIAVVQVDRDPDVASQRDESATRVAPARAPVAKVALTHAARRARRCSITTVAQYQLRRSRAAPHSARCPARSR